MESSMSGHSKWANIKHRKGAADAKKGKIFSKIAKEIMVVASTGGGDPAGNIALRALIQKARSFNMPASNIERAIKKGIGDLGGVVMEELVYEGYGPGGVAMIVSTLTDNRNRTAAEIKHAFSKSNSNLGGPGSVSRSFQRKGQIIVNREATSEETIMDAVLEAGAEDMVTEEESYEITMDPNNFMNVVEALNQAEIPMETSEITMLPDTYTKVTDEGVAVSLIRFIDALEDLDDVQNVYTNFDIEDDLMEKISQG